MSDLNLKNIIEAALHAANRPLSLDNILSLFADSERPERNAVREIVAELGADYEGRGIELVEVASGWRIQVRTGLSEWISRLWQERPPRYSRALLETLSIVAYRQPVTRGEIEEIRGVSVSSNIMRTLLDRGWVRVVGHRDVPGKPALFATTRDFLDYFGLKRLEDLPPLADLKDLDSLNVELELGFEESGVVAAEIREPEEETGAPDGAVASDDDAAGGSQADREVMAVQTDPLNPDRAPAIDAEYQSPESNEEQLTPERRDEPGSAGLLADEEPESAESYADNVVPLVGKNANE
jgi:segregation and condensation protein B